MSLCGAQSAQEGAVPLELELQVIMNHRMGTGDPTEILRKSEC